MIIEAKDMTFSYEKEPVFSGLSLTIERGEVLGIIGPNGIGKSTLIRCLCNIYSPQQGAVFVDGRDIASMTPRSRARTMGYVPQTNEDVFSVSVYEAVLLGRRPHFNWMVTKKDREIVTSVLKRLNLDEMADRQLIHLSGGERQKVALARALAQQPSIYFLDEPTSNLDMNHQLEVMEIVKTLVSEDGAAVVMIMHDLNLAGRFSDSILLLGEEGIFASGSPRQVLTPENIREVYGVEVEVVETGHGTWIMPLRNTKDS